ncbi:MAG: hypothetical protein F6J97_02925 [Leptolyngbya sp. SIO4C1]|nr:hypothetical protein [Leptolyngbya sp. SIO4C1]
MGKRLALLIGTSEYGSGFEALPGSLKDLQAMKDVLEDPDCGAFDVVECWENRDRNFLATRIEDFFRDRTAEDILLFYFSGHGDLGSGGFLHQQLHLCVSSTYKKQGQLVESSALSTSFLKRQLDLSRAQKVVILDCCYSGAIADLIQKGEADVSFASLRAQGQIILASSSAVQPSLQEKHGLSLYTQYLIEGMRGAAYPGQGDWILAQDLHAYAERRFEIEKKGSSSPVILTEDTAFNLPIVKAPRPKPELDYRNTCDRIFQELDRALGLNFNGVIETKVDRGRLDTRRENLGLSLEEAQKIEEQVRKPYIKRAEQRQKYARYFKEAAQDGYIPEGRTRQGLMEIRQNLSLGESDAAQIEQALVQELSLKPRSAVPSEKAGTDERYRRLAWVGGALAAVGLLIGGGVAVRCGFSLSCSPAEDRPQPDPLPAAQALISAGDSRFYGSTELADPYETLKQQGIDAFSAENYSDAEDAFEAIRNQAIENRQRFASATPEYQAAGNALKDPEILIYLNNA